MLTLARLVDNRFSHLFTATPTRSLPVFLGMRSMEGDSSMNINNRSSTSVIATDQNQIQRYPRLSEILRIGDQMSKKKKMTGMKKQKPIVPLVWDLLSSSWKRRAYNNSTLY